MLIITLFFLLISVNKSRNIIVNTIDMRPKVVSKINNGKIEAIGKHQDLVEKDGMYQRIYKIQTKME